jgi:hypothetical protein
VLDGVLGPGSGGVADDVAAGVAADVAAGVDEAERVGVDRCPGGVFATVGEPTVGGSARVPGLVEVVVPSGEV